MQPAGRLSSGLQFLLRLLALLANKPLVAETQQGQTRGSESAPANES